MLRASKALVQEKEDAAAYLQKELTELRLHNASYVFNGLPYFRFFFLSLWQMIVELNHRCREGCSQLKVDLGEKIKSLEVVVSEKSELKSTTGADDY